MMEKVNLEELFREKAKNLEEKPEERVWQRIEKHMYPKKEVPRTSFKDKVWFSAAVYALIAVPVFVLYYMKKANPSSEKEPIVISNVESKPEKSLQTIEQDPVGSNISSNSKKEERIKKPSKETLTKNTLDNAFGKTTKQTFDERTEIEKDAIAISEKSQLILATNLGENKTSHQGDESQLKTMSSATQLKDTKITKMVAPKDDNQSEKTEIEHKTKKIEQAKEEVVLLPDQFLVLDSIFKVNFRIKEKKPNQLLFQNKEVELRFRKDEKDSITIESTDQINPTIKEKIERRKKEIFQTYEK
ncbi:hypothetical protein QP547_00480 [Weeksella virosa]|nr:hypothetical protein [Weeksella virosa]